MKKVKFDGDARGQKGKHLEKKRRNATLLANTPKRRKMDGTLAILALVYEMIPFKRFCMKI